jgi:hypothetical protein
MDPSTLLLMLVVVAVATSQLLNHSGRWILKPWVFWPAQALLVGLLVYVLLARLEGFVPEVRMAMRGFLMLFVSWRLVHNWRWRSRVHANLVDDEKLMAAWKARGVGGIGNEDDDEPG